MSKSLFMLGLLGTSALTLAATVAAANAQAPDKVRWKMQSAFASTLTHLGPSGLRFAKNVERMSGGKFEAKFFEPGALVPPLECFDAVSKGSIESCWTTPGYHTGKYPALAFFTTVPFGPGIGEFQVMQKLGVSTQLLAAADIYPALERGVVDATEFSMPAMDIKLGFHQIAKFNYFPGWHQQVSCGEVLMNKKAWEALPDAYKAMIETAGEAQTMYTYAETEATQFEVMAEMRDKHKVQVKRWSDKEPGRIREGVARGDQGRVGQGPAVQEGRRPLPRFPQEVRDLGRMPGDEAHLSRSPAIRLEPSVDPPM